MVTKAERQAKCHCGSGQPYYRCCMKKERDANQLKKLVAKHTRHMAAQALDDDDQEMTDWSNQAVDLTDAGKYEEALALCDKLEAKYPEAPDAYERRGYIYAKQGRGREGAEQLRKAASCLIESPEIEEEWLKDADAMEKGTYRGRDADAVDKGALQDP